MLTTGSILSYLVLTLLMTGACLLFLLGAQSLWKSLNGYDPRKVEKRLQALARNAPIPQNVAALRPHAATERTSLERRLLRLTCAQHMASTLAQIGGGWTLHQLLLACAALGLFGLALAFWLHPSVLVDGGATAACAALPLMYVQWKRRRRMRRLERQLPDALDLLTRGLKAGQAFSAALQMIGDDMAEPLASEFRLVNEEVAFGISMQQALTNLSNRVPLTDMRYFVVSVLIQRESGGNLTEVLENLSRLIRDRFKLRARIRILSSEGRLSAWVLGVMPFALAGLMNIFNPTFIAPLWHDPIGLTIVKTMLTLMAIGIFILRQIVRIRV